MIETVVVDLGGVAARFRPERRLQALASMSGVAEAVIRARLFDSGFEDEAEIGLHTPAAVIAAVQAAVEHRVEVPAIIEAWALSFEPTAAVLDYIRGLGVQSALFTNNGPDARCLSRGSPARACRGLR